ncbi:MAG: NPCBM/NEW2 domain-containing protein [Phycisphaerales bacterium JB038]
MRCLLLAAVLAVFCGSPCRGAERVVHLDELDVGQASIGWGAVQRNKSVDGNPLRLAGAEYERGMGTHADSTLHLELDGRVKRFTALVGVDDEAREPASVRFRVIGDGKVLFDSGVMGPTERLKIDVDTTGVRQLTLHVDDAGDGDTWDHADWANARFHCEGDKPMAVEPGRRWRLGESQSVVWEVARDGFRPHRDHLEMAGLKMAAILTYGVDAGGELLLSRRVIWPMLRTIPNNTHGSLEHTFDPQEVAPTIRVDGMELGSEFLERVTIRGMLTLRSRTKAGLIVERMLLPSIDKPMLVERVRLRNVTEKALRLEVEPIEHVVRTKPERGVTGAYLLEARLDGPIDMRLQPGKAATYYVSYSGRREGEERLALDGAAEVRGRLALMEELWGNLVLETPSAELNQMFAFAKLRGAESIYATKGGLMHGPGGGRYYAALWTNDHCEYINPLFPLLGYEIGNESALNSYRHFARYMDPEFERPLVSSVIAEGEGYWNGAGDRGDAAMFAYGAARYALALGDRATAEELWPWIEWCLEFCQRKLNENGVIASDSDELEGRFPAGEANLCTSSLAYDAYLSAAHLGDELGKSQLQVAAYRERAAALREAIEAHFGARVEGYDTYRYYAGNTTLRAWICIPLTVGIDERAAGTIEALFSKRLWGEDGLATEAGREDFWDRSTLYALRGVFAAGATEEALTHLAAYTHRRLVGGHVPYPVEAYPEGNQRHLSAESGLYCRIFTEGLFGMRPTGLHRFELNPRLPAGWERMNLRAVRACGGRFDIIVERAEAGRRVRVVQGETVLLDRTTANDAVLVVHLERE